MAVPASRDDVLASGGLEERPAGAGPVCACDVGLPWRQLHQQYDRLLRSVAYSFRLTRDEAEDAAQTTWMLLVQHADSLRDPERVGGWLRVTMRRSCMRVIRQRCREQLSSDWASWEVPSPQPAVDSACLRAERDHMLWQAVDSLPDRQRELIRSLYARDEASYDEISAKLAIPKGAIGPTRMRALRRLRQVLDAAGARPDELLDELSLA